MSECYSKQLHSIKLSAIFKKGSNHFKSEYYIFTAIGHAPVSNYLVSDFFGSFGSCDQPSRGGGPGRGVSEGGAVHKVWRVTCETTIGDVGVIFGSNPWWEKPWPRRLGLMVDDGGSWRPQLADYGVSRDQGCGGSETCLSPADGSAQLEVDRRAGHTYWETLF